MFCESSSIGIAVDRESLEAYLHLSETLLQVVYSLLSISLFLIY